MKAITQCHIPDDSNPRVKIELSQVARCIIILILLTATELSLGGSSPYTSTDKTNKNKYTQMKQYQKTQYKQYKTQ